MLEILSDRVPYHNRRLDAQVIMDIFRGVRHRREDCGSDMMIDLMYWQLMERCWEDIPDKRPDCVTIVNELECLYWHQQLQTAQTNPTNGTCEVWEEREGVAEFMSALRIDVF